MNESTVIIIDKKTGLRWEYQIALPGGQVALAVLRRIEDLRTLMGSPSSDEIGV